MFHIFTQLIPAPALMWITSVLVGAALVHCSYALFHSRRGLQPRGSNDANPEAIWTTLNASESLEWQNCYPGQVPEVECALLLVSLNYSEPISSSNNASIAIIRTLSPYPPSSENYKGPLLFNPGGPGGSGVDIVLNEGQLLRTLAGDAFDIVGFDPRGVSRSTPTVSFFDNSADRNIWASRASVFSVVNTSTNSLAELVAGSHVVGQLATVTNHDGYLNFINTDYAARDMLQITKAYGRDKIQYWGISYGSILGMTFASLFPDNVGRLVVDGVVDGDDYFSNQGLKNVLDTDKTMQTFFDSCYNAGPSGCAFYASSPTSISQNLAKLYDITKSRPFGVFAPNTSSYGVVDYNFLRNSISYALYFPYLTFPLMAEAFAELSKGNAIPIWEVGSFVGSILGGFLDAGIAISCNDGNLIPGTLEDAEKYYNELAKTSDWADVWAGNRLACSGWPDLPKNIFRGPLMGKTSHPILFIGNEADPVTPLQNAKKMSKRFPGSVVLTQDSAGHTSISGPSTCTMKYFQAYLVNGTLP
ncbi:Alpha/Beta hydrolase protein, partial [Amanita rubescens]